MNRNSGRKLGVEVKNLDCKGLRLEPFLYLLMLLVLFNLAQIAHAKKHPSATTKSSTKHVGTATTTRSTRTGKSSRTRQTARVNEAPATGRHHHGAATTSGTTRTSHSHTTEVKTKTVKTVHVVHDRHGRIIRRETRETVVAVENEPKSSKNTKHHTPLAKEEQVVTAKEKIEPQSPPENQETPSEYHDFQKAYALYDEGNNARLAGNYSEAINHISRALSMVPSNAHGGPSVLVLNMEYDLAQAAENSGDLPLAARYYARALADRPNFPEASVHLAKVLAQSGKLDEALKAAREGVVRSPSDPRTHSMLALLLNKNGQTTEANIENRKAQSLLSSSSSRSYVQPGPGSIPSFKTNSQNTQPTNEIAPVNSTGVDDNMTVTNKGNSKNTEDEGFMP